MTFRDVAVASLLALASCTPAAQQGIRCRMAALDGLPAEPEAITLGDAIDLVKAVKQCGPAELPHREYPAADAGG